MQKASKPERHVIFTTYGADGACAAAMLLQVYPKAEIIITSARKIAFSLDDWLEQSDKPVCLHILGVGIAENLDYVTEVLQALAEKQNQVYWYCGRGYLDAFYPALKSRCTAVFIECESNTQAVLKHFKLKQNALTNRLLNLARQFIDPSDTRTDEQQFWHDMIDSSASRYFKYEDRHSFIHTIQKLADISPLTDLDKDEVEAYRRSGRYTVPLGDSKAMKQVRHLIQKMAPLDEPVLIIGPTGSGKEIAARLLHEASQRRGLFVPVNCAILSTSLDLAHDRLFGHTKGAYTGAHKAEAGAFEVADQGTLFLDEVAELPLSVQTQLLRVLEEGSITPMGTQKGFKVDVRILAATNQNLNAMINEGRFRTDLYHRLNVLQLNIPSLRERGEDMKSIAKNVIYELNKNGYTLKLTPADWKHIHAFEWPGNIRQFINLLKRAAYLGLPVHQVLDEERQQNEKATEFHLSPDDLQAYHQFRPFTLDEVQPFESIRTEYIRFVYNLCEGNITQTADRLRLSVNTVKRYINQID